MADRICVMNAGRIEQIGTPQEVYYRPASEYVARFFGDNNLIEGDARRRRRRRAIESHRLGTLRLRRDGAGSRGTAGRGEACWSGPRRSRFGRRDGNRRPAPGARSRRSASSARSRRCACRAAARPGIMPARSSSPSRAAGLPVAAGERGRGELERAGHVTWSRREPPSAPDDAREPARAVADRDRRALAYAPAGRLHPAAARPLPASQLLLRRAAAPMVHEPTLAQLCPLLHRCRSSCRCSVRTCVALPRGRGDLRSSSAIRSPTCWRACEGRRKYVMTLLFVVPLLMSYIIKIYAIRSILGGNGFLNRIAAVRSASSTQPLDLLRLQPQRGAADA